MYRKMLFGESNSKDTTMQIASDFFPYLNIIFKDW